MVLLQENRVACTVALVPASVYRECMVYLQLHSCYRMSAAASFLLKVPLPPSDVCFGRWWSGDAACSGYYGPAWNLYRFYESRKMGAVLGILGALCYMDVCAVPLIIQARRPICEYSNLIAPTGADSDRWFGQAFYFAKFYQLFYHGACFFFFTLTFVGVMAKNIPGRSYFTAPVLQAYFSHS